MSRWLQYTEYEKLKQYKYGTKLNATTSKFKMLNHNSNVSHHLVSQSGLKAIVERFGGGGAKSRRFGGRSSSSEKCTRFFPCFDCLFGSFRTIELNWICKNTSHNVRIFKRT